MTRAITPDVRSRFAEDQAALMRVLVHEGTPPCGFQVHRVAATGRSLLTKRIRSAARAWPRLSRTMGPRFSRAFAEYAGRNELCAEGGPYADGYAFARWLARRGDLPDPGRMELAAAQLRFARTESGLRRRAGPAITMAFLRRPFRMRIGFRLPLLGEQWLKVFGTVLLACAAAACGGGVDAIPELPLHELREEWRLVSNDSSRLTRFTSLSDASPLLPGDRLMLIDAGEALIRIYAPDGKLLESFGRKGTGPLEFNRPAIGGYVGDTIWINDPFGGRVHLLDTAFASMGTLSVPIRNGQFIGLVAGQIVVVRTRDTLNMFNLSNELVRQVIVPRELTEFLVSTTIDGRSRILSSPYSPQSDISRIGGGDKLLLVKPAEFWGGKPGQLSISWIAMPGGATSDSIVVSLPPEEISADVANAAIDTALSQYRITDRKAAGEYRGRARVPRYAPAFSGVALANETQVWLTRHFGDSTMVVVSTAGQPLMRVRVPSRLSLLGASGEFVWALDWDANDIPMVVKYRVVGVTGG